MDGSLMIRLCLFLMLALPVGAATYYIDFDAGNDTNAGTSTGAPWKTIPGTRNTGNTDWQATDWGSATINSGNKAPAGTVFQIKPTTTHDSTDGGKILIDSTYYDSDATAANPIKFVADQGWAAGTVTIDGTGITAPVGFGLISSDRIPGMEWDGEVTDGFLIQDSPYNAIVFNTADGLIIGTDPMLDGAVLKNLKIFNCGTTYTGGDNQVGVVLFEHHQNILVDNVEIDGNDLYLCGLWFGNSYRGSTGTVSNTTIHDFSGTDNGGNGILSHNGFNTFSNVTVYGCNKGFDLGEENSQDVYLEYTIINCLFYGNVTGFWSSGAAGRTENMKLYVINSIFRDNTLHGIRNYSGGPYQTYLVHNTFDNNGTDGNQESGSIRIHPDGCNEEGAFDAFLYNNIFFKPAGELNYINYYIGDATGGCDTDFDLDSDYNSWVDNTNNVSAVFARTAYSSCGCRATGINYTYDYNSDGPGNNTGNWYTDDDEPGNGTFHVNSDANSKTSDDVPFTNVASDDFTLTTVYPGTDISGKPWYTSLMGTDRAGIPRTSWDMGAYEFGYWWDSHDNTTSGAKIAGP